MAEVEQRSGSGNMCRTPGGGGWLDWLDGRSDPGFFGILYGARWIALLPCMVMDRFLLQGAGEGVKIGIEPMLNAPVLLFVFVVLLPPLMETLIECTLPYAVIAHFKGGRTQMPARPWGFVATSAIIMALLHPIPWATAASLITGAFLAYTYGHFAKRGHGPAFAATALFHAAINIVGFVMFLNAR